MPASNREYATYALISLQKYPWLCGPLLLMASAFRWSRASVLLCLAVTGWETTLMKVMAAMPPSTMARSFSKRVQVTHLPQEVPNDLKGIVFDIVFSGLGARAKLLSDYHHVVHRLHTEHTLN